MVGGEVEECACVVEIQGLAGAARPCGKGARRVQLVRRDGRDVSTLYGREGGGGALLRRPAHPVARVGAEWRALAAVGVALVRTCEGRGVSE